MPDSRADYSTVAELLCRDAPPAIEELAILCTGAIDATDAVDAFWDASLPEAIREGRAVSVVFALARDRELLDTRGVAHRKRAIAYLTNALGSHYRDWSVNSAGEDFELVASLAAIPEQAGTEIRSALDELVSLETIDVARNALQRALGRYRACLSPLVPAPLTRAKIGELFDAERNLAAAVGSDFLAAHSRSAELIADYRRESRDAGPIAEQVLAPILTRFDELNAQEYATNPATLPASLTATPDRKKYSLGISGAELRLGVLVENDGPGQALDVRLEELDAEGVELRSSSIPLGQLMPGTVSATIPAVAPDGGSESALVVGNLRWRNSDGSEGSLALEALFESQRSDIDWDSLKQRYDLDPVRTSRDLVGRGEIMREICDLIGDRRSGSAFITGQKRVGKTSVSLTFQALMSDERDVIVIYLEAGVFVQPTGERTVAMMGAAIAEELIGADPRFDGFVVPAFEQTLSPLRSLIGQMRAKVPKLRVMIALDEFDELPIEMYRRGPVGDAFFLALRSLSGQEHIGFLLIGGEKMAPIIDAQGDQLNKFEMLPVTYLDRQRHWDDFTDLVRLPVADCFEITDDAVLALFDLTAGHPYFTKLICRSLFKLAVRRRDAFLTEAEVGEALTDALLSASTVNFIHFWEDGVLDTGESIEEVSVRRRKILLAYAELQEEGGRSISAVIEHAEGYGISPDETRDLIREFERRGILEDQQGELCAKVKFFDLWLRRYGVSAITTTFTDPDAILNAKRREIEDRVGPEELAEVVSRWGLYRGERVTVDDARAWLKQFETSRDERLMFGVLKAVRFYDATRIRAKLKEAHGIVIRGITQRLETGRKKRDEIVVSYLGPVGKSGVRYARMYADENNIYTDRVVEASELTQALNRGEVQALVIVDDLLGSGDQACEFLEMLSSQIGSVVRRRELRVVFIALAGFDVAQRRVQEVVERVEMPIDVHVCDVLGESDRCFSVSSLAYASESDRLAAKGVAESHGRRLQRKAPLGYKGAEATVVFDESCPNSTLPILWDSAASWRPLFARHKGA